MGNSAPIRILIVNNFARVTGGADIHCLGITRGLRARGHEVEWLSTESPDNVERFGAFVPPTVTAENRADLSLMARVDAARRAIWNRTSARAMTELINSFGPDLVHVHKSYVQLSVAPIHVASSRGIPIVQTVHDYEFLSASPFDSRGGRWDHEEDKFAYQALNSATFFPRDSVHSPRVDSWIAVSRSVAETYESIGGIKCTVIPNFAAAPEAPAAPAGDRNGVLFLGRLSSEKGIDHVLEAARLLAGVQFTIAGDGPMKIEVETAAKVLDNLSYVGFVDRSLARKLIRGSIACLMPSLWEEPGPLASLEAMAEGTPVICYPKGGLAEYVADSGAGIVCGAPEVNEIASAIDFLSSDSGAWSACSNSGVDAVLNRHSLATYMEALESLYASTIDGV